MQIRLGITLAALIVGWWSYTEWVASLPFFVRVDPQMAHMVNSLSIFKGQLYQYMDHPGTPISIIGSLLLALSYPFTGESSFIIHHLRDPETFFTMARCFLALSAAGGVAFLARHAVRAENRIDVLAAVAVALSFFAAHGAAPKFLSQWSHHSFQFPFPALTLIALFLLLRRRPVELKRRHLAWLGLASGVLAATLIFNAVTLIGITTTLVAFRFLDRKTLRRATGDLLTLGASAVVGFFLSTIPAAPGYLRFFARLSGGSFSWANFANNRYLIDKHPEVFVSSACLAVVIALALWFRREHLRNQPGLRAFSLGMLVQLLATYVGTLIVVPIAYGKNFLIIAGLMPVLLATAFALVGSSNLIGRIAHVCASVFCLWMVGQGFAHEVQWRSEFAAKNEEQRVIREAYLERFAAASGRSRADLNLIFDHGGADAWSRCAALWYGDAHVASVYHYNPPLPSLEAEIASICPRDRYYFRRAFLHVSGEGWRIFPNGDLRSLRWPWDVLIDSRGFDRLWQFDLGINGVSDRKPGRATFVTRP
jgi:hypothetical protein